MFVVKNIMIFKNDNAIYLGDLKNKTIVKMYSDNYYDSDNYIVYVENNKLLNSNQEGIRRIPLEIDKSDPLFKLLNDLNAPSFINAVNIYNRDISGVYLEGHDNGKTLVFQQDMYLHRRCDQNVHLVLGDIYTASKINYEFLTKLWNELPDYVNSTANEFLEEFGSNYTVINNNINFEKVLIKDKRVI